MDERVGPQGQTLYVDPSDSERGSEDPFYSVFVDEGRTRRWGYFCSNCESFATAMDSMGRIQCTNCGNFKKPDEWDAAHE